MLVWLIVQFISVRAIEIIETESNINRIMMIIGVHSLEQTVDFIRTMTFIKVIKPMNAIEEMNSIRQLKLESRLIVKFNNVSAF